MACVVHCRYRVSHVAGGWLLADKSLVLLMFAVANKMCKLLRVVSCQVAAIFFLDQCTYVLYYFFNRVFLAPLIDKRPKMQKQIANRQGRGKEFSAKHFYHAFEFSLPRGA
jgi:hypothetical protein